MKITNIDKNMKESAKASENTKWIDVKIDDFSVHGLLWKDVNNNFHRLVDKDCLRENLTHLSLHPSGVYITFQTNSTSISLKASLSSAAYMSHMTAIGQCGFDLYVECKKKYVFLATTKINAANYEITLLKDVPAKTNKYLLYFPLYTGFNSLELGIDQKAFLKSCNDFHENKIVCYGTSITQGGCATRPGMNYSSIIGRYLDFEVYNLGFSGNAHLDYEIAQRIKEIDKMKYLIVEVEANTSNGLMFERLEKWLDIVSLNKDLKKIYLITHYPLSLTLFKKEMKENMAKHFLFQKDLEKKYPILEVVDGKEIFKDTNFDEAVDGVHLTDLGFYILAKYLIKKIKKNKNF